MMEPIQGESGVHLPDDDYLKKVRQWCDQKGILLILDEIQTGIGRTGTLFAYEQYDVEPDIMTLAKGLAGGFPIGAILCKDKASVFAAGEHGSTFGGNPLACATGYAVLKTIVDNGVSLNAKVTGQYLTQKLNELKQKYAIISEVRGRGLLQAIEFKDKIAQAV
jgi:acetylornithine/succinyldiaminopimelate/putrescine aminotransferase